MKDRLIFDWPGRHHLHLMLPVAVLAALAVHAGLFFIFSILYPRPRSVTLDAARVFYIPASSAEHGRLEAILRSEDPSVFAPGRGLALPEAAPPVGYIPQYHAAKPVLEGLPDAASGPSPVSAVPSPVPAPDGPGAGVARPPGVPFSWIEAGKALASRAPAEWSAGGLSDPDPGSNPSQAVFLIGVRQDGSVAHIFLQQNSGSEHLDRRAMEILRGARFSPGGGPMDWDFIVFRWGTQAGPQP